MAGGGYLLDRAARKAFCPFFTLDIRFRHLKVSSRTFAMANGQAKPRILILGAAGRE